MNENEFHDTVTLADGSVWNCEYVAVIPTGYLFAALLTDDPAAAMLAWMDSEKTSAITYGEHNLTGYTVFVGLNQESPGHYKIAMRKRFADEEGR